MLFQLTSLSININCNNYSFKPSLPSLLIEICEFTKQIREFYFANKVFWEEPISHSSIYRLVFFDNK